MRRPFMMGILAALAGGALVGGLVGVFTVWSGVVDVGAHGGGVADRVLGYASQRSIRRHAPVESNPVAGQPAAIEAGLKEYRSLCVPCHGGPGAQSADFAAGLHPPAPDLASAEIQAFTDGMLYETIAHGIGSTGMPAFGATRSHDEVWRIVAFVRTLPTPSAAQRAALAGPAPIVAVTPPATAIPAGKQEHQVTITQFKFDPAALEVKEGDVVVWTNKDFVAHTATADDKSFDTGKLDANQSRRVVMTKSGTVPYFCRFHLAMRGTITVR